MSSKDQLRMHFPAVKLILDPHKMEDAFSMAVVSQLYRGLLRFTPKGDVTPDIADRWTESPDHLTYTFHLRQTTFSDGSPISAKNVVASYARVFATGASMAADLDYLAGVPDYRKSGRIGDLGIRALSDREVEFHLSRPSVLFLKHVAVPDTSILPVSDPRGALDTSPTGNFSGPYRVVQASDNTLEIQKWRPDALDSRRPPQSVEYLMTDRSPTDLAKEELTDSLDRDPLSLPNRAYFDSKGWQAHPTALMREEFVILNPSKVPAATRQYLFSTFDSEQMLSQLQLRNFQPAFGIIPDGLLGELSKGELTKLKTGLGKTPAPEAGTMELEFDEGNPIEKQIGRYLQGIWSTAEFKVVLRPLPKHERLKRMFGKLSQASLGGKQLDYPDGYSVLTYFKGGIDSNYFHVADAAIDRQLTELVSIFDANAREAAYRKVQLEALRHFTFVPIFFGADSSGYWSARVANVPPHPAGYHTLAMETVEMK